MAVSMIPLLLVGNLPFLAVALFVAGLSIAPTMITTMALVEQHVPRAQLTEGMTWMSTGLAVGVALGSSVAGWVIDAAGAQRRVRGSGRVRAPSRSRSVFLGVPPAEAGRCRRGGAGTEQHTRREQARPAPWRNWAGNVTARPGREVTPASVEELVGGRARRRPRTA